MRVLVFAFVAVCLLQGLHAESQLSTLVELVSSSANPFDAARKLSKATSVLRQLNADDLLDLILDVEDGVSAVIDKAGQSLGNAVNNVDSLAVEALEPLTANWNTDITNALAEAAAVGVDVRGCAADGVLNLAKSAVTDVVRCGTDKVYEAVSLLKEISALPGRARTIAEEGSASYQSCSTQSAKGRCRLMSVVPVALQSVRLVSEAVGYSTEAVTLVATLKTSMEACAANVVAQQAINAAGISVKVVGCIIGEIKAGSA